ncbi:ABC transporter ATP-binding protein [Arthrobacter sp. HY1533]|uniref:ABC transporter ATP-binding protein n=1 Tax=Arthrobacter sp. HY1533 TaxID=2970919 RepID=UPI0022BA074D|nr:ABC transporter ATP-binding protein [Arthrobacter sp. HY1533]
MQTVLSAETSIAKEQGMNKVTAESGKIVFSQVDKIFAAPSKTGDRISALLDLNLAVKESEIVSIVGPTGCGKSTALNMVAGFDSPSNGSLLLDGSHIHKPGPDRAVVFQHAALFPWMNVFENVVFGVKSRGMDKEQYQAGAEKFIKAVGLSGFEKHYPYQISGGMQQRVQIARALISNPEVLLMDEPFGALDYQTRILMQQLLLELWAEFRPTILFITHDVSEAIYISDRVIVMGARPGRVKLEVDVTEPKPRSIDFLTTPSFTSLEHQILETVQQEITASRAGH